MHIFVHNQLIKVVFIELWKAQLANQAETQCIREIPGDSSLSKVHANKDDIP